MAISPPFCGLRLTFHLELSHKCDVAMVSRHVTTALHAAVAIELVYPNQSSGWEPIARGTVPSIIRSPATWEGESAMDNKLKKSDVIMGQVRWVGHALTHGISYGQ